MDRATVEVYEREGAGYATRRGVQQPDRTAAFAAAVRGDGDGDGEGERDRRILDLGSGPGHHLPLLGPGTVALDAALAMAAAARRDHGASAVQGDLVRLPLGARTFAGVWASKAHQHVPARDLPEALAEVHRVLVVGGRLELTVFAPRGGGPTSEQVTSEADGDDLPGRWFTWWDPTHLRAVIEAAGFIVDQMDVVAPPTAGGHPRIEVTATAARALPDHVGADLRLLCCGINPSWHAADAGVGYVTGSNRFWRAMAAAGLATVDRDPRHLLHHHRIGMTDLVKRPTARADELRAEEHRAGLARLDALCSWLAPAAVVVVGLVGWRAAVDRTARVGWQERRLGPSPVYLMPSTSGLNAGTSLEDLVGHLLTAAAGRRH